MRMPPSLPSPGPRRAARAKLPLLRVSRDGRGVAGGAYLRRVAAGDDVMAAGRAGGRGQGAGGAGGRLQHLRQRPAAARPVGALRGRRRAERQRLGAGRAAAQRQRQRLGAGRRAAAQRQRLGAGRGGPRAAGEQRLQVRRQRRRLQLLLAPVHGGGPSAEARRRAGICSRAGAAPKSRAAPGKGVLSRPGRGRGRGRGAVRPLPPGRLSSRLYRP